MSNTLGLVLKHKYYDMIESGEKPEEYLDFCPYWIKRLCDNPAFDRKNKLIGRKPIANWTLNECKRRGIDLKQALKEGNMIFKDYTHVRFHRGYTSTIMTFEVKGMSVGQGREEWGAPKDKETFIIKFRKRI